MMGLAALQVPSFFQYYAQLAKIRKTKYDLSSFIDYTSRGHGCGKLKDSSVYFLKSAKNKPNEVYMDRKKADILEIVTRQNRIYSYQPLLFSCSLPDIPQ